MRIFTILFLLTLSFCACRPEIREPLPVGERVTDDSRAIPAWMSEGHMAVIDLSANDALSAAEISERITLLAEAGFRSVLLLGSFPTHRVFNSRPADQRPKTGEPLDREAYWPEVIAAARAVGMAVLADYQPSIHHVSHPSVLANPQHFLPPDTTGEKSRQVRILDLRQPMVIDSVAEKLRDRAQHTGLSGFLLYDRSGECHMAGSGLFVLGFNHASDASDFVLIDPEPGKAPRIGSGHIPIYLCRPDELTRSELMEAMLRPGVAAIVVAGPPEPEQLSLWATGNRLRREVQATKPGALGGPGRSIQTDSDSCITAFVRTAGATGLIFARNRCAGNVEFVVKSPIKGIYRSIEDYRILSDFSPNRLVIRAREHVIFVRQPDTDHP